MCMHSHSAVWETKEGGKFMKGRKELNFQYRYNSQMQAPGVVRLPTMYSVIGTSDFYFMGGRDIGTIVPFYI